MRSPSALQRSMLQKPTTTPILIEPVSSVSLCSPSLRRTNCQSLHLPTTFTVNMWDLCFYSILIIKHSHSVREHIYLLKPNYNAWTENTSMYLFLHLFYYSRMSVFSNQWDKHTLCLFFLPLILRTYPQLYYSSFSVALKPDSIFVLWYVPFASYILVKGEFIEITEDIFSLSLLVFSHADHFD